MVYLPAHDGRGYYPNMNKLVVVFSSLERITANTMVYWNFYIVHCSVLYVRDLYAFFLLRSLLGTYNRNGYNSAIKFHSENQVSCTGLQFSIVSKYIFAHFLFSDKSRTIFTCTDALKPPTFHFNIILFVLSLSTRFINGFGYCCEYIIT